ncbi:hypothetical protein C9374_002287 [Naegleria lovaniensis]|uniref:Guanine nucleotide-binding protein subunit beta-like protein n=1 Tax=Naegleria lovaniensis TaxID=51637 RepID=A0AA88KLD0_NAELO|nr:uncharacterized protein C9374_002287 [Naegleria lovaniensis]KAG2386543.1 hypothetical protein C9374_002287 [Naegleria lovaniensis]
MHHYGRSGDGHYHHTPKTLYHYYMTLKFHHHHSHHHSESLHNLFQSHSYYDSHLKSSLDYSRRVKIQSPHVHAITGMDLDRTDQKRFLLSCGNDRIIAIYDCLPSIVNGFEYYENLIEEESFLLKKDRMTNNSTTQQHYHHHIHNNNSHNNIHNNIHHNTNHIHNNTKKTTTTGPKKIQPIIKPIHTFRPSSTSLTGVMWYPNDCGMFFSCGKDQMLNVFDTSTMTCVSSFDCLSSIYSMDMFKSTSSGTTTPSTLIACALEDHSIRICDLNSGANIQQFIGHSSKVRCVKWSPHSEYIFASASNDGTIRLWDIRTSGWLLCMDQFQIANQQRSLEGLKRKGGSGSGGSSVGSGSGVSLNVGTSGSGGSNMGVDMDKRSMGSTSGASSSSNTSSSTLNRTTSSSKNSSTKKMTKSKNSYTKFGSTKFSPAKAYNYINIKVPLAHNDHINSLCFSNDGEYLFSSSNDQRMMKWVTQTGMNTQFNCKVYNDISSSQSCQLMCHGGKYSKLIFHAAESFVEMFDQESGEKILPHVRESSSSHYGKILSMCFDENRQVLYTAGTDFAISIWDTNYGMFASPEEQVMFNDMDDWSD